MKFRFIDLLAGIGGIRLGFESVGGECVFSSEWDKYAQDTYEANFGERPHGDITQIKPETIPEHDILLAGFPCQAFSICGDRQGFLDTRGTLFFNIEEILRIKRPYSFLLENVKNLKSHDKGRTFKTIIKHLEALDYYVHYRILNSLDFGIVTIEELSDWYNKALTGKHCSILGDSLLENIKEQMQLEFPSVGNNEFNKFVKCRGYDKIQHDNWKSFYAK